MRSPILKKPWMKFNFGSLRNVIMAYNPKIQKIRASIRNIISSRFISLLGTYVFYLLRQLISMKWLYIIIARFYKGDAGIGVNPAFDDRRWKDRIDTIQLLFFNTITKTRDMGSKRRIQKKPFFVTSTNLGLKLMAMIADY